MKKYRRIRQPKESYEENPCWDCCFGENGECNAPQEILDSDEECGFTWSSERYIYEYVEAL